MSFLSNVFTKGTQAIPMSKDMERSAIEVPANVDWPFVIQITGYEETSGIIQGESIWDLASPKSIFYARAYYDSDTDIPSANDVEIGQCVLFNRVGKWNNNPSVVNGFDQGDTTNINKVSFACIIERNYVGGGVPALCECASLSVSDLVGTLKSYTKINHPQISNLKRLISYKVSNKTNFPIVVLSTDDKKIIIETGATLKQDRGEIIDCSYAETQTIYNLLLEHGEIEYVDGTREACWIAAGDGDLNPDALCCECVCSSTAEVVDGGFGPVTLDYIGNILNHCAFVKPGMYPNYKHSLNYNGSVFRYLIQKGSESTWYDRAKADGMAGVYDLKHTSYYMPGAALTATIEVTDCDFS